MNLLSIASILLIAIAIAMAMAISGCATAPQATLPDAAAGIARMARVSGAADTLTAQYAGVSLVGNERQAHGD